MGDLVFLKRQFLSWAFPAVEAFGTLRIPFKKKLITQNDINDCIKFLDSHKQPSGLVFLSRIKGSFTNLLIPGFWTHTAMWIERPYLMESVVHNGVQPIALAKFMEAKDYVCIMEPLFATSEQMVAAANWVANQKGKPYDKEMAHDLRALSCCELVGDGYIETMGDACPFVPRERFGEPTFVPQDFYNAKEKWKMVWSSKSWQAY